MQVSQLTTIELPLVNKFYQANKARGKAKRHEQLWVVREKGIIAACRLQYLEYSLLLVGLMVDNSKRHQGIGKRLVASVCSQQSQALFTFPYASLQSWYQQLGFELIQAEQAPPSIQQKFSIYQQQGRDIVIMLYKPKT